MIDAIYRTPLVFQDEDGEGVTLPNLKEVGWTRTPSLQMPGTRTVGNFMLVHALLNDGLTPQEIQDTIPGECLLALEWPPIPGTDTTPPIRQRLLPTDTVKLLDFMQDIDDVGTRPTDLSVMHQYAGRPWYL